MEEAEKIRIEQERVRQLKMDQENSEKRQREKERVEKLQREREKNSSSEPQDMDEEDDWNLNPDLMNFYKSQQAMTFKTINIVRDVIGTKRNIDEAYTEPIPVTLEERNIMVFAPSAAAFDPRSIDIPDDFYEVTNQDLRLNAAIQKEKKKEKELIEGNLRTKEMRERDRIKKLSKYKKCFIRIRFPDRVELQGTFLPLELMSSVYKFVSDCLQEESSEFHLYTIPPKTILKPDCPTNLRDLQFLPACIIYFSPNEGAKMQSPFLKEHLVAEIKEKLPPPQVYIPPTVHSPIIIANPITQPVKVNRPKPENNEDSADPPEPKENVPSWFKKGKK